MAKKTNYEVNGINYFRVRTTQGQLIGKNGKPIPKAFVGKSKKEAEQKLNDYLEGLKRVNKDYDKTFIERFEKWLNVVHASSIGESSLIRYISTFELWIATAPYSGLKQDKIESIDIQEHLNGLKPTIAERVYNLLSTYFKYCVLERQLQFSPLATVNLPPRPYEKPKKDVLTRSDVVKLNELFSADQKLFIYKFALYTGMRVGEISALTHNDIDITNKTIKISKTLQRIQDKDGPNKTKVVVGHPKTDDGTRNIPIYTEILMDLRTHMVSEENKHVKMGLDFNRHTLLFTNKFCKPMRADHLNENFKKLQKANGIEPVNFHKMRATFATMLADGGVPMKTLMEILGDKDIETVLKHYTKVDMQSKSQAVKTISRFTEVI
jgi:integrase